MRPYGCSRAQKIVHPLEQVIEGRETPMVSQQGVLIVEDDHWIRQLLSDLLVEEGYCVASARHGKEALDLLNSGSRPCVMVLDLMMPVMDGWQLLAIMREDSQLQHIPVLVVSASRPQGGPEGATRFLSKPINVEALLAEVGARCCRQLQTTPPVARPQ